MNKILSFSFGFILFLYSVSFVFASSSDDILWSVVKLKNYQFDPLSQSFIFQSYGSAIAIGSGKILTNAHVVLDSDGNTPTGYYEVCISQVIEKAPVCSDTAKLIAYDLVADLALLELDSLRTLRPIELQSSEKLVLGSEVIMYGYPSIGWDTITRTQWKIAGYTAGMYKIDGTIDHGDSGGWAFNHSGILIGMPTAVASDNGVIGYMIDRTRIYKFLQKRTENYELFREKRKNEFLQLMRKNQQYKTTDTTFVFSGGKIQFPKNSPFRLISSSVDPIKGITIFNFRDTYDRINVYFQCTRDGSSILWWRARSEWLPYEPIDYNDWKSVGKFEWEKKQYFTVYDEKITPGDRKFRDVIYYTQHDACYAEIFYYSRKLDAKLVDRAHSFLKDGVIFTGSSVLLDAHANPYFSVSSIGSRVRVVEALDTQGQRSVNIAFDIGGSRWINTALLQEKYTTRSDFFRGTLNLDAYNDVEDWETFISLAKKNVKHTSFEIIESKNQKKILFLLNANWETGKTRVLVYYPYKLHNDLYAVWFWDYTINDAKNIDLSSLRSFFSSLIVPWVSPF
jgi:Trypsin-like peptidase domain